MSSTQNIITRDTVSQSLSWQEYTLHIERLATAVEKPTPYNNEKTLQYTLRNYENTKRVLSYISISQKLYNRMLEIKRQQLWLVISEPWCGDVSHVLPVLYAIASCSELVTFRLLLRDANSDIMNHFLTEGSESIPKLLVLDEASLQLLGTWGPRPQALQQIAVQYRNNSNIPFRDKVKFIHQWYDADKSMSIQEELLEQVRDWVQKSEQSTAV